MRFTYLIDNAGALSGPVEFTVVPGMGQQLPANAISLTKELPMPALGLVWAQGEQDLQLVEDHRGTLYSTADGAAVQHKELGPLPAGLCSTARPSEQYQWHDGEWVKSMQAVKAAQLLLITTACEAEMIGGFQSSALGCAYWYDSLVDDQLSLAWGILAGQSILVTCADEQGAKELRLHTSAQLRQVGDDFTLFKLQLQQKLNGLKQLLNRALEKGDLDDLESVTWEREL